MRTSATPLEKSSGVNKSKKGTRPARVREVQSQRRMDDDPIPREVSA